MASYIERSLGAGEKVVARAYFPWLYSLTAWAALLLVPAAASYAWLFPVLFPTEVYDPFAVTTMLREHLGLVALLSLPGLLAFLKMMIRKWTTEIGVTSHRFVEKYGLVTLRTNEIALHNIEGVRVTQTMFGKLFGYGTVRIEGTGVDAVTTPAIADPVGFVKAIQTARELEKA